MRLFDKKNGVRGPASTKPSQGGFTLIEMLVVMTIIAIMASVVIVSMGKSRARGRDARRKTDLKQLEIALITYYDEYRVFPSTNGVWFSSESGDGASYNSGNYIPGLAPVYITNLPRDPGGVKNASASCNGWKAAYLYKSNGLSYKLLSHCSQESTWDSASEFYDPVRPTWGWKACGGFLACTTW